MFGLLNYHNNCFVVVDEDYSTIKLIQHLIGTQFPSSCVDISAYECKTGTITAKNCCEYSADYFLFKNFRIDKTPYKLKDDAYIDVRATFGLKPLDKDQLLIIDNIRFLLEFLKLYTSRSKLISQRIQTGAEQQKQGLREFEKFLMLQTGPDEFIRTLVSNECYRIDTNLGIVENHQRQLYKAIMNINIKVLTVDELISRLNLELKSIQPVLAWGNEYQSKVMDWLGIKSLRDAGKRKNG